MPLTLPNLITWLRILLIPVFVGIFYLPPGALASHWINFAATAVFVFAALTDWLDGYLARMLNQMSAFGAFLDPVADKLMVAAALIVLVEIGRVDALVALIIIGREIAVSALREWMANIGHGKNVAVSIFGKIKTAAQMIAITLLLYHDPFMQLPIAYMGTILIYVAAVLTLLSMLYYLKKAAPALPNSDV